MRPLVCSEIWPTRARGRGGIAPTAHIETGCGRPAVVMIRGLRRHRDGRFYPSVWRALCAAHERALDRAYTAPDWLSWIREHHPDHAETIFRIEL